MRFAIIAALLVGAASLCARDARAADAVTWEQVEAWIWEDAATYGVSGWWLVQVARCEGAGNPYAVGRLGEYGPFQFHPRGIWWSTPIGLAGVGPYQASIRDQVSMAAWAFSRGLSFHWSCAR